MSTSVCVCVSCLCLSSGHSAEVNSLCLSCPMTYLAFAWLTALTNQVIRLMRHSEFTSALCSEIKQRQETQTEINLTHNCNCHHLKTTLTVTITACKILEKSKV